MILKRFKIPTLNYFNRPPERIRHHTDYERVLRPTRNRMAAKRCGWISEPDKRNWLHKPALFY